MKKQKSNLKTGKRLSECREEAHLTQAELAKQCFFTPQTISYIENGKRGLSRDLAHKFAQIMDVKEEYLLLESDFKNYKEEIKHHNKVIDMQDSAVMNYLYSLGHNISFNWKGEDGDGVNSLLDYCIENGIDMSEKSFTHLVYGNDLLVSVADKKAIAHNVKVSINGALVDLVDYLDLIEDLNNYTDFLISKIKDAQNRRLNHIGVSDAENAARKGFSSKKDIEKLKELYPDAVFEGDINFSPE